MEIMTSRSSLKEFDSRLVKIDNGLLRSDKEILSGDGDLMSGDNGLKRCDRALERVDGSLERVDNGLKQSDTRKMRKLSKKIEFDRGLTITEANACGTPHCCSNIPGLRDAIIDGNIEQRKS